MTALEALQAARADVTRYKQTVLDANPPIPVMVETLRHVERMIDRRIREVQQPEEKWDGGIPRGPGGIS